MKTITFDSTVYKIVPIDPTEDMIYACTNGYDTLNKLMFHEMLTVIPNILPGVIEHSLESVAEVMNKFGDPEAFAERELKIDNEVIQKLPIGAKLYYLPPRNVFD